MKWVCGILVGLVIVAASVVTVQRSLSGQERVNLVRRPLLLARQQVPDPALTPPAQQKPADDQVVMMVISVADALLRPLDLPFGEPTTLNDVQKYLAEALGAAVVLDRAAMDRLDVDPDDTVELDLKGVRLKTGLKLLLDQVGMTWRVVPEDNLLILTDAREAGEPIDRALTQLKAIHDEMHDLQDAVDDLRDLVEEELGIEPETDPNAAIFVGSRSRSRSPATVQPTPPRAGSRSRRPASSRSAAPERTGSTSGTAG